MSLGHFLFYPFLYRRIMEDGGGGQEWSSRVNFSGLVLRLSGNHIFRKNGIRNEFRSFGEILGAERSPQPDIKGNEQTFRQMGWQRRRMI